MLSTRRFLALLALVALPVMQVAAQTCVGAATFDAGKMRLGVSANFFNGGNTISPAGSFGSAKSLFADVRIDRQSFDEGGTRNGFGGSVGYQFDSNSNWELCPMASISYIGEPHFNYTTFSFGAAVGHLYRSGSLDFVPAGGLGFTNTSGSGGYQNSSAVGFLGLGFVANRKWTITPSVSKSFQDNARAVYGISFGYSFLP